MLKSLKKPILSLGLTLLFLGATTSSFAADIERISVDSNGVEGNFHSFVPNLSADGRYVVFESAATNLVPNDTNGHLDIFVHDRNDGSTTRVNVGSNDAQADAASNNLYLSPISADGRYVVFASTASNLIDNDTNEFEDIFVRDRTMGTTSRVSISTNGVEGNAKSSSPLISSNGRYVTFRSVASNLVAGDTNGEEDVFVYDRETGKTTRENVDSDGVQADDGNIRARALYPPAISDNGLYITFSSIATNLVKDDFSDVNSFRDVFLRNRSSGVMTRISTGPSGANANGTSSIPTISADGRYVAYVSFASNLVAGDENNIADVFVYDIANGSTTRVTNELTVPDNSSSYEFLNLTFSGDGRFLSFSRAISNSGAKVSSDAFIYDQTTGKTTNITTDSQLRDRNPIASSISGDGKTVVFSSYETNLVTGDTNGASDIFITRNPFSLRTTYNDFDGDGKADILWRHATSGQNWLYLMDGPSITSSTGINSAATSWKIQGTGDFDNDGHTDVLWRNVSSGVVWLYLMDGTSIKSSGSIGTVADLNWQIKGVADFNDDGKADILWRNSATGLNFMYLMSGTSKLKEVAVNSVPDQNWRIEGVADFDGNGKADILWRNAVSGINWIYLMNGTSISSQGQLNVVSDLNWQIQGTGDFDNDGKEDVLWRNVSSGVNWIYLMNGISISSSGPLNVVSDLNWKIENVADLNGDGNSDIVWRNSVTGLNFLYLMDGISNLSQTPINSVQDLRWQIQ